MTRAARKNLVFPIMYGRYCASTQEMKAWRTICADFINGHRALIDTPLTLDAFRLARTCGQCGGQLPPYDEGRFLVFCGRKDHWDLAGIPLDIRPAA